MTYWNEVSRGLAKKRAAGNREKRKVLFEVGRAIVALSEIENLVSHFYHDYCEISTSECMPIFFEQSGIEKRVKLTDLVIALKAEEQHRDKWRNIISGLEQHRIVRNIVAHYGIQVDAYTGDHPQVYFQHPELKFTKDGKRKGKLVLIAEVREAADASRAHQRRSGCVLVRASGLLVPRP